MTASKLSNLWRVLLLALVLVIVAASVWIGRTRKHERAAVGRELVFDDFGFQVELPNEAQLVEGLVPEGQLKIVRLRISNHARVVPYALAQHQPRLVDADGRVYVPMATAIEHAGAVSAPSELAAGDSCVQELYFDVPSDARDLRLRVSWGQLGDELDYLLIGDKSFALP